MARGCEPLVRRQSCIYGLWINDCSVVFLVRSDFNYWRKISIPIAVGRNHPHTSLSRWLCLFRSQVCSVGGAWGANIVSLLLKGDWRGRRQWMLGVGRGCRGAVAAVPPCGPSGWRRPRREPGPSSINFYALTLEVPQHLLSAFS